MSNDIQIVPLSRNSRDVGRFLKVSYSIYRDDPHWVAPLLLDQKKVFLDANPLFQHAVMQLWVARRNGQDIGRIAGIIDHNHNHAAKDQAGFFGFFETVNEPEVSRRLFDTAVGWTRQAGLGRLLGPMNPTTNDECGLLIEGFDSPPVLMMTYNPRYYVPLVEAAGFRKTKDLLAFHIDITKLPLDRLGRIAAKIRERNPDLVLRPVRRKTLAQDVAKIKAVYNEAWEANWGFVPMTDAEMDFMVARLKPLLMEGITWLAEVGGEPVGFLLALPDYNRLFKPLRGRLLHPRVLGVIPYLLGWKCLPQTRTVTLGVKEKYRIRGLESAMLIEGLKIALDKGIRESEASWILEDNVRMCRMLESIGSRLYKTYRIYERPV